jgi:hypothetical protein
MAAATKRIYIVVQKISDGTVETRLVRAANRIQAENFVASTTISAELASQDDLIEMVGDGVKVEDIPA